LTLLSAPIGDPFQSHASTPEKIAGNGLTSELSQDESHENEQFERSGYDSIKSKLAQKHT